MAELATVDDEAASLDISDFELLNIPFLNSAIRTSQSMAWFADRVILGAGRAPLGMLGRYNAKEGARAGGGRADTGGSDLDGAQILVFDPVRREWQKVYDSPAVQGRDGQPRARDRSVRARIVCQTAADSAPCLYLGVGSLEYNVVFLRSENGIDYQECAGSGFGLEGDVPSVRAMACLNGRLFCTPTGKNLDRGMLDDNLTDHPVVFETSDPLSGRWVAASEPGFGDPENKSINELAVFDGHLYAATLNPRFGFQLWKTDAQGVPPYRWVKLLDCGAWRGATSSTPAAVVVFRDALYLTAGIQRQGRGHIDQYGPFAAEMLRVYSNDTWDIVTGTPRFTPHGLKRPVSGLAGAFGDPYTHALWRMAIQDGQMYVGTAGWQWMPTYLRHRPDLSKGQFERLWAVTDEYRLGEFSLWRTPDGAHWEAVTRTGFEGGNPQNYGIRELLETPYGLFVAPTARSGAAAGGGLELWWGHKH